MIDWVAKSATTLAACGLAMLALALAILAGLSPGTADAGARQVTSGAGLRLVMVDDPACGYCRKWEAEVGVGYGKSAEGRRAPLVKRDKRSKDLDPFRPLVYTPTFVLVENGAEVGRIVGYPGPDFFWAELEKLMSKTSGSRPAPQRAVERDAARPNRQLQPG